MKITKDSVASITYELRLDGPEGDMVEKVEAAQPFAFLVGTGNLLPKFEGNLTGLGANDFFDFLLPSADAYGDIDPDARFPLSKEMFMVEGKVAEDILVVGNSIPMQDQEGNVMEGTVIEVGPDSVVMDFNHPLAGKTLHFRGRVVEVRPATADELSHGHAHGPGGHQHS